MTTVKHAVRNAASRKSASPKSREGAPVCGVGADDYDSAGQDQSEPRLLHGRKLFSKAERGDQSNE
jgi:hypothetical protein